MENIGYTSILRYLLQVWDILSDMLFCQEVHEQYIKQNDQKLLFIDFFSSKS